MKLVQLNIWQGKITIAVIQFLKEQDADIVCLQEVFSSSPTIGLIDNFSALEQIQKDLDYPYCYFEPTTEFFVGGVKVSFGNCILSKFKITNKRVFFTNHEFNRVENFAKPHASNIRNCLVATIETPHGFLTVLNHHGYHEFSPVGSEITVEKMKIVGDEAKKINGPLILAGDLNVTSASKSMRVFDDWLEDLTDKHKIPDTLTIFGKVHGVPCDHILVNKQIKVNKFEVSKSLVSDHTPLVLEFDL